MLSRLELEELSYADLKDLVKQSGLEIPQYAKAETLVDMMEEFYGTRQKELAKKLDTEDNAELFDPLATTKRTSPESAPEPAPAPEPSLTKAPVAEDNGVEEDGKGRYAGFHSKRKYINHMLEPVLCIITPQSPEFSRQTSNMASISVGNALISNREFGFIADGGTVTSVPRIALNRIRELKVLLKGSTALDKNKMTSNTQGSAFGTRFRVHVLSEDEVREYAQSKGAVHKEAATGIGL